MRTTVAPGEHAVAGAGRFDPGADLGEGWVVMDVRRTLIEIERMREEGVFPSYAVGGAVGATFYLEPMATVDVDIFAELELSLDPLRPVFDYARSRGFAMEGQYVLIAGWPVQFLPSTGPLVDEAFKGVVQRDLGGTSVPVFSAEYLAAIALQTGRPKDRLRLLQFLDADILDEEAFAGIVQRHGLGDAFAKFKGQVGR